MNHDISASLVPERTAFTERNGLSTEPLPLAPYRTQEFFDLERDQVFRRAWLLMGRVEEIPNPGDYIVKTVDPCNVSALITRSKNGRLHAFYNSCSHRGSEVVAEPAGNRSRFVCPYHSWTYGSEGELLAVTDEASFFNMDKAKCGLRPIALDTWEGWYFINLQPEPEVTLQTFLGPLADHLKGLSYLSASTPIIITADLDANWKVVFDAFLETYHIPAIHKKTIATTFSSRENPHSRLLAAKVLGAHSAVSMYGNPTYTANPNNKVEALAYKNVETGSVIAASSKQEAMEFLAHPSINPGQSNSWSMDANAVFPHAQIDCGPGGFWCHQFWPVTPNTCRYEVRFYVPPATTARQRFQQEMYVARIMEVLLEDLSNVARTQRGIDTGGKTVMHIQDSEIGIRHQLQQVIKWTQAASVKEALA